MKKLLFIPLLSMILALGCTAFMPTITTFDITPATITAGSSATLTWNVPGANSVVINPQVGAVAASGSQIVSPTVTTAYTITVSAPLGTVSRSVVLVVNPAPLVINLSANPAVLMAGGSAALQWNVMGADSVSIDQGIGSVPVSGNQLITPAQTTTYTLTASNTSGILTKSFVVTVNPPIVADLNANPVNINVGQSATLTWNVSGADSVSIDQGIGQVPPSGSRVVTPYSTTSYDLTASSSCCIVSKAATVTVGTVYPYQYPYGDLYSYPYNYFPNNGYMHGYPYGYGYPGGMMSVNPFIEIFSISPSTVHFGQPVFLHWNVVGATSVDISGIGSQPSNGSQVLVPIATTTYTLTALNSYGSDSRSVTVT
ncbi:MAG: hypothetical protein ABSF74_06530, partial [Dehalococcoidia bacterium]